MLSAQVTEQINNREIPDNLYYKGAFRTHLDPRANQLHLPSEIWEEMLDQAGIDNVVIEPGYEQYVPELGPWKQNVAIHFTPGLTPRGEIMFQAVMYQARITGRSKKSLKEQEICRAFITWNPDSVFTEEVIKEFIKVNPTTRERQTC